MPITAYWLIELEVVRYTFPTIIHPFSNVIFVVFWLLLIRHILVKNLSNAWYLSAGAPHHLCHAWFRFPASVRMT